MSKYLNRLNAKADAKEAASNGLAAEQAKYALQAEVAKLQSSIATVNAAKEEALGSKPFNINSVFSYTKEKADLEAKLALVNQILTEELS
jgi:hypothetical protein